MRNLTWTFLLLGASATALPAQSTAPFGTACADAGGTVREHCYRVVEAVQIMGPRTALVLSGGNPLPGTASTLGMRIGSTPRFSVAARVTGTPIELPGLASASAQQLDFNAIAVALDAGLGVFNGFTLGPTVGGFGAVDLLASVGHTSLPDDDGFGGGVTSWAAGARLGLLRESFTAPGISLTAMYRSLGDVEYGAAGASPAAAWFTLEELRDVSLRATLGKRFLGLGWTAGAGWDWYDAHATAAVPTAGTPAQLLLEDEALESSRSTLFANAAFTLLILHTVAELGWQSGGTPAAGVTHSGRLDDVGFYGSLALRLTL
jgi:hypothetical protein